MKTKAHVEDLTHKLNEIIVVRTTRPNGTRRIQRDFQYCPTMSEQHTAHLSNINYLMSRYKPDELAAYIAARGAHKKEIIGHDFSQEPSLQEAKNVVYQARQNFEALPEEIKSHFKNHVEFLKFIDNPANADKMVKLGILKPKQIEDLQTIKPSDSSLPPTTRTPTQEKDTKAKVEKES